MTNMFAAKKLRIHGMQDERWIIKDRINQFKGVANMYGRDKKIHDNDLAKTRKRQWFDIKQLRKELDTMRYLYSNIIQGDPIFLRNTLSQSEDKALARTYQKFPPDVAIDAIHQYNFHKRKRLDLIYYEKKLKMEDFRRLQFKLGEMKDMVTFKLDSKLDADVTAQTVANSIQCAIVKKNAALALRIMYNDMLSILKKDAIYYSVLLEALIEDCRLQGKCLINATEMGQLAVEYLDDRKYEFEVMQKDIKFNMKERERTLKLIRLQLKRVSKCLGGLIKKDDVSNLDALLELESDESIDSLEASLDDLEYVAKSLQHGIRVPKFDAIIPRLEFQKFQTKMLTRHLRILTVRFNASLNSVEHARIKLEGYINEGQEETTEYQLEKQNVSLDIEAELEKQNNITKTMHTKGEFFIFIREALQNLYYMLRSCDSTAQPQTQKKTLTLILEEMLQPLPEAITDVTELIELITMKLQTLVEEFDKYCDVVDPEANAFYIKHITILLTDSYRPSVEVEADLLEYELEDPAVSTYASIKLKSKVIVESQVNEFEVPINAAPGARR